MRHNPPAPSRPTEERAIGNLSRAELVALMSEIGLELARRDSRRAEKKRSYNRRREVARREASQNA